MRLSNNRYEEIKQEVADFFESSGARSVPVNGFEMATKAGIKIISYSSFSEKIVRLLMKKSEDGFFLLDEDDVFRIYYNDIKEYSRVNFTIMHELGHIVLGHTQESELAEAEANFFAKFALAPPVLVHKFEPKSIAQLSDIFEISYEAASYAYNYYKKWLRYGDEDYTKYEMKILGLFENVS